MPNNKAQHGGWASVGGLGPDQEFAFSRFHKTLRPTPHLITCSRAAGQATPEPCVVFMPEGSRTHKGGTMRLGTRRTLLQTADCMSAKLYQVRAYNGWNIASCNALYVVRVMWGCRTRTLGQPVLCLQ